MSSDDLTVSIRLRELRSFLADTRRAGEGVESLADTTEKATRRTPTAMKAYGSSFNSLRKLAIAAGAALITSFVGRGVASAVNAASDLNEEINKSQVVFRGSEKTMIKWSEGTAEALGISQRQALASAGIFGNMLVPMGYGRKEAGKMSRQFVGLAADMSSFNNASPEETLDALRAGLAGETEPLRKYGVFLNEARIKQEAINKKLWDGKGQISAYAKAQAITNLIMLDTKDAQGDVARTSDSLANTQRRLSAQWENIQAQVGQYLLPYITKFAVLLSRLITEAKEGHGTGGQVVSVLRRIGSWLAAGVALARTASDGVREWVAGYREGNPIIVATTALLGGLVAYLVALYALRGLPGAARSLVASVAGLNISLLANPIVLVTVALFVFGSVLYLLYQRVGWFRRGVDAAWGWVRSEWPLVLAVLTGPLGLAVLFLVRRWDAVTGTVSAGVDWVGGAWDGLGQGFGDLRDMGKNVANGMIDIINAALGALGGLFTLGGVAITGATGGTVTVQAPAIPRIPHLAAGGTAVRAGTVLVGEHGPEIMHMPAGTPVAPPPGPTVEPVVSATGRIVLETTTRPHLDPVILGRFYDRYTEDRAARN